MAENLELGARPLSIEDVEHVARQGAAVQLAAAARARIAAGRQRLDELLARGERIYGVNTGVGGNQGFALEPEQMQLLQHNLLRHLSCAPGDPLPGDVVRAAMLLRLATGLRGAPDRRAQFDPFSAHRRVQRGCGELRHARRRHRPGRARMRAQRNRHGAASGGSGRGSARGLERARKRLPSKFTAVSGKRRNFKI